MTSTNDGKDVKSYQISGQKAKTYYIELYKTLDSRLSTDSELDARTSHLCEAWRRVHCLCLHSAPSTHPHLISWLQRHTAQTLLQSEWQKNVDKQKALEDAVDFFISECHKGVPNRASPHWESQLLQRAQWFKKVIPDPWGNSVLKALLGLPDPSLASSSGEGPTDQEILEWLKEERGVFFVTRLRQLGTSNCTELTKVALKLASAVMDRIRACTGPMSDGGQKLEEHTDEDNSPKSPTFMEILTKEAGFTIDILELITDIEFVLLHKDQSKCIDLAKRTPLNLGYQLVERLNSRLELSPREKRLWKNSKKVATLIAQVMVARCMVVPVCANSARSTLYGCSRSLVKLLPEERLPATMAALAAPAATSRHLHTLAHAVHSQCKNERKPFVCELYIRAITTGMNELERLKLNKEKESEARAAEQTLSSWFTQLGSLLGESARLAYECALTAFSVHPSRAMYDRIADAPTLQPHSGQTHKDVQEPALETNTEFGSWATDSRSQTNFVKTSETLNLKKTQQNSNVLSTAILNEGETLGLSPELCQDLIVLLSGPRVKTLSWDMDKEILIENCRSYMERTHGGTKALTTELKYLNLNPDSFNHLPEEEDEDEGDIYYGIEKGYEHLVELQDPEEIWEDALTDLERTESCYSTDEGAFTTVPRRKKKTRRLSATTDDDEKDPLSTVVSKPKPRSRSDEGAKVKSEHRSKERSKERKKKERHKKEKSVSIGKKKEKETPTPLIETDPLMLEIEPPQPKPKKERKKREKKEKKEKKEPKEKKIPKKKTPVSSALSRLIGKKVIRVNANTQQKISGAVTDTNFNNQLFISDSDYDSQGKSSVTSMHTEGNDPNVLFDGLYSMDEIKLPEKSSIAHPEPARILNFDNLNQEKLQKPMNVPTCTKIMNSQYVLSGSVTNKQAKPPSIPMLSKNKYIHPPNTPSLFKNEKEDVKLNIKRLLEFRRQKSATDLYFNRKSIAKPDPHLHNSVLNTTVPQKFGSSNTVENGLRIQSGCPKAISVPNIPKVYINKQQSEQINVLKNEVDSYLMNINNNPNFETKPAITQNEKSELRLNNEQLNLKSNRPVNMHLNNTDQKIFNTPRHNTPGKVINNVISNPALRSLLKPSPKDPKANVSSIEPNFQEFLKDLQRSINAGVCKTGVRSSGNVSVNETPTASPLNYSAKQIKSQKKVEIAPNTFARLNYMHKNKQGETLMKQNNDQVLQNRLHPRPVEAKKVVNILSDTIISPGDRSVIKTHNSNNPPHRKVKPSNDGTHSTTISNIDQCVIRRPIALDEKLTKRSMSTPAQPTNYTSPKSTMLTDTDQNQLLLLLRQQSKLNITRPQIRENVINRISSNPITSTSTTVACKSLSLNLQNTLTHSYSGADNINNQIKDCQGLQEPPIQPNQNISVSMENVASAQPRTSIIKIPETSKPNILQQKTFAGNTKKMRHPKGDFKINSEPQDWQSVMDALSAQKTPSRGFNALDMVLQKDSYQKHLTNNKSLVRDQQVVNIDSVCNLNNNVSVITNASRKEENILNCKMPLSTSLNGPNNGTSLRNHISPIINKAPSVTNKLSIQTDESVLRKSNPTFIIKRVSKTQEPQISFEALKKGINSGTSQAPTHVHVEPLKKELNLDVSQTHTEPMLSDALPTFSDYDLLEELMDDDLRQEIGELLSDEESFSSHNTILKANKVKSDMKQIPTDVVRAVDMLRNSSVRQNFSKLSKQNISNLRPDTTVSKQRVTPDQTTFENTSRKKSKLAQTTTIIQNTLKNQPVIHKTPTKNVVNNVQSPLIISKNTQSHQEHHITKNVNKNNHEASESLEPSCINHTPTHVEKKSIDDCSNSVLDKCLRPPVTSIQTPGAVYTTVTHQPVQNVVLIRPELVYEPYLQVQANGTNINSSAFVAVPNIPIYSTQLAGPVINPVIIASPVTVSNIENSKVTVSNIENNKPIIDNSCNNICDNALQQDTASPHSRPFEQGAMIDNVVRDHFESDVKTKSCYNTSSDKKVQPTVLETQTYPIKLKKMSVSDNDKRDILKFREDINSKTDDIAKAEIETRVFKVREDFNSKTPGVTEDIIKTEILKAPKYIDSKASCVAPEDINSKSSGIGEVKRKILKAREDINLKTSVRIKDELKKEIFKAREDVDSKAYVVPENNTKTDIFEAQKERMKNKRNAILNRQVYVGNNSKPIPLSYAPLLKVYPENIDEKLVSKPNVYTGPTSKTQVIALGYKAITGISQVTDTTKNVIGKNTDTCKIQEKKNSTSEIILKDMHKEKIESDKIEISSIMLRSSVNKLVENTSLLTTSQSSDMCVPYVNDSSSQNQPSESSEDTKECESRTLRSSNKFIQNKLLQNANHDGKQRIHNTVYESSLTNVSKDSNKIEEESNRSTLRLSNRSVNKSGLRSQSFKHAKKITIHTHKDLSVQESVLAQLTDSLKENNKVEENESTAITQRPSHQLPNDNSPLLSKRTSKKPSKKIFKTKVRLNLKNIVNHDSVKKDVEIKRLTKPKVHKIQNKDDKTVKQTKNSLHFAKTTATDLEDLDFEEQLLGSIILKDNFVTKEDKFDSHNTEPNKTKENDTKNIVVSNSTDLNIDKTMNSSTHCSGNLSLQKEMLLEKSNVCEKMEITKENHELNPTKLSDINDITPYVKLVSNNSSYNHVIESGKNVSNTVNIASMSGNKSLSVVDDLPSKINETHEVNKSNDLKTENEISSVKEKFVSIPSRKHKRKMKHDLSNEENEIIEELKDKITIKELPRKETDDPLKRCISIKLSNGNSFKATVTGKLHIDIDSLFEDPSIRSVLLNNVPSNARCILNVQQVGTIMGDKIKTKLVYPEKKNLETINLISDDEDDDEKQQVFKTEFGIFNIKGIDSVILNKHQNKFSQNCSVIIKRCKVPLKLTASTEVEKIVEVQDSLLANTCPKPYSQDLNLSQICKITENKNTEIIEIDESSNDSVHIVSEPFDVQQLIVPEKINKNIKELKETLLQDLCVDVYDNEQSDEVSFTQLVAQNKETFTDICSKLTDNICKELNISKEDTSDSVRFVDKTTNTLETREIKCKRFSPSKKKHASPKRCRLNIERCDELIKQYQIQKNTKKCFISLERCDNLLPMYTQKKACEIKFNESNESLSTLELETSTKSIMENETSESNLKRSDSFSILNDFDILDQCHLLKTCKKYGDIEVCQSDWLMTKSNYYYLCKHLHINETNIAIINDNISTDCESDFDTSFSKDNERTALFNNQNQTQIPSLLKITLKILRNYSVLDLLKYEHVKTSKNSMVTLKRKLSPSEYFSNDTKILKLDDGLQSPHSSERNMSGQDYINIKEINLPNVLNEKNGNDNNATNTENEDFNEYAKFNIQKNILCNTLLRDMDGRQSCESSTVALQDTNKKCDSVSRKIDSRTSEVSLNINESLERQDTENKFILERLYVTEGIEKTDHKALKEVICSTYEGSVMNDNLLSKPKKSRNEIVSKQIWFEKVSEETCVKVFAQNDYKLEDETQIKQLDCSNSEILVKHELHERIEETNFNISKQTNYKTEKLFEISQQDVHFQNLDKYSEKNVINILKEGDSKRDEVSETNDSLYELQDKHEETDLQHLKKEVGGTDNISEIKNNLFCIQNMFPVHTITDQEQDEEKVKDIHITVLGGAEEHQVQSKKISNVLRLKEIATKTVVNLLYGKLTNKMFLDQCQYGKTEVNSVNTSNKRDPDTEELIKSRQQDREIMNGMESKEACCSENTKEIDDFKRSEVESKVLYTQQEIQSKMWPENLHLNVEAQKDNIKTLKRNENETEESAESQRQSLYNKTLLEQPIFDERVEKTEVFKLVDSETDTICKNNLFFKQQNPYTKIESENKHSDDKIVVTNKNITSVIPEVNNSVTQYILKDEVPERKVINNKIDCGTDEDKIALEWSFENENLNNTYLKSLLDGDLVGPQETKDHNNIKPSDLICENYATIREKSEQKITKCDVNSLFLQTHVDKQYSSKSNYNMPRDTLNESEPQSNEKKENISSSFKDLRGISESKQNTLNTLKTYIGTETKVLNHNSTIHGSQNIENCFIAESGKQSRLQNKDDESVTEPKINVTMIEQTEVVNSDVSGSDGNLDYNTDIPEREKSMFVVNPLVTKTIEYTSIDEKIKKLNTYTHQVESAVVSKRNNENCDTLSYLDKSLESENNIDKTLVTDTCKIEVELKDSTNIKNYTNVQNQESHHKSEQEENIKNEINNYINNENHVLSGEMSHFDEPTDEDINGGVIVVEGRNSPEKLVQSNVIVDENSLVNEEHSSLENIYDKKCDAILYTNSVSSDKNDDVVKETNYSKIGASQIPKNITLLYEGDSSVILKGSIIEDAIVGTCYVFPLHNTDLLNSVMHNSDQIENEIQHEESVLPELCNELIGDTELVVTKPKLTYSKSPKVSRRSLKRKFEIVDSKILPKKYRKGKNIDYPKITVAAMCEYAYSKEFKKLSNYFSSIKFSYTKDYHLIHLQDVHSMLEDWPIKELHLPAAITSDADCSLFVEKVHKKLSDPSTLTLAEEISANYDDEGNGLDEINETNFSMGFGERSGRVNLNFKNRRDKTKFMAATLSDVKQIQPILLPASKHYKQENIASRQDQFLKLDKFYSNIKLRDKIRSYFKETTAMLNYSCLENGTKSSKDKSYTNSLCDDIKHIIFDFNNLEFFEPAVAETIVQIVQIGQPPVSAAAQNPVTCDPRVTQVTDASLPQCSMENDSPDDLQANIKTEYTELTTADISLPIMPDYEHQHQTVISASQVSNLPNGNDNITIETEVKIEVLDEVPESIDDNSCYDNKDFPTFPSDQITNNDQYQFNQNDMNVQVKTEPDLKIVLEPTDTNPDEDQINESQPLKSPQQNQQNGLLQKPDQLAHAMNAAGITPSPEPISEESAIDLSNTVSRSICEETEDSNFQRSTIAPLTLQQALTKIIPQHINQTNETENNSQTPVASQLLHIVHGKNTSLNQLSLADSSQQSVANTHSTPVFHIVQSKGSPSTSVSNGSPPQNPNSFNGLSLLDAGLSQGGNQLLHIVNANAQKSNTTPVLKRVNLVTNVTNAQGSCEQKMVQILCKSADPKGIQLNAHQRSMVLRLHPIETPPSTSSKSEPQDTVITNTDSVVKDPVVSAPQVELKSRSVYEENYAKFIQDCNKQAAIEPSVTLPKFNQAFFGKPVFQENNQKNNDIDVQLPSVDTNIESNCQSNGHAFENTQQIGSPLLLRKTSQTSQSQQNLAQHVKQAITPMNIQTMHGGVIYTRQIPVNIGSGQTINLITVPSTERVDESVQKQKPDVKFATRGEIEQSFIKIVPQTPVTSNTEISTEETNTAGLSNENAQNPQPPPMLTQMRIKLPMLSKNAPMVPGARVVRPSFFQIQRNVIGGANQPVYQQLVLTAAPTLGHNSIRLPQVQANQEMKEGSENQSSPESEMSSSTLHEQLQEFDKIMEQVKERSTGQPAYETNSPPADTNDNASSSTSSETTQQILYSIGNNQQLNVAYINKKPSSATTTATSFARSPDSSSNIESPTSSTHVPVTHIPRASTSETSNDSSPSQNNKLPKPSSKSKSRPKTHHPQFKFNHVPPKPSNQKPIEDEQTTQRILYILAEYKEQVENSPDKDKPAPRRRTNLQAGGVIAPGGSKSKKKRRNGRDSSPIDDNRTMGSEDSSCGTSQGDCNETCNESNSPQGSPRKVAKKLSFDQDPPVTPRPQPPRNVLVTDGPTIAVTRAAPGKPATAVLMPANYILPVSMVKSGQQIAIVTNRGPKILTVGGADGGATNALLLQRLIGPAGLKPMLARPSIRHVRLPTAALQNLQAFNLNAFPNAPQSGAPAETPAPASSPPQLVETKTPQSPWTAPDQEEVKPERESSPEEPEQEQEPWSVPQDYSYEETVRTEMDRTVLDAIPDRYSPDMEAERIFDKMFDVESKKDYINKSQADSPHCPYDIDASDGDDRAYHQVVQRRDGVNNRHRFLAAATLRQKFALMEDEMRLQKSLSEECEDLGVDSPSASDLFPEAELLFSSSPAHEASQPSHTPQPAILGHSSMSPPDVEDQAATDHLIAPADSQVPDKPQTDDIDLGLEDVGIVTVSEDGMRATISLDHEEFVRSHPNTTFHREPTDDGEAQPITIDDLKARHLTSTIFHAGRAPATVLVSTPQTTVISQATPDGSGVDHVRCPPIDNLMPSAPPKDESLDRFDSLLNDSRELHLSNSASAIIHSTGNATQVIRRVSYEDRREEPRYLDDPDSLMTRRDVNMTDDRETMNSSGDVDDDRSSPERNAEMFWEMHSRARRLDFSSDSDKCCKSPYDENNSTDSSGIGTHMRLDSVIKDARVDRTGTESMSLDDGSMPPLRTYAPKRTHHESHSGRRDERYPDSGEGKRRASNRGVVKRGCHCCNGSSAPAKPKKPRHRKPHMDN